MARGRPKLCYVVSRTDCEGYEELDAVFRSARKAARYCSEMNGEGLEDCDPRRDHYDYEKVEFEPS
jgi:hypothetical protein